MAVRKIVSNPNRNIYLAYNYLMYPINLEISDNIAIGQDTYYAKSGYHVSLVCLANIALAEQKKILNFAINYPIKLVKLTNIFRFVVKGAHKSIIVRVEMEGLKELINAINNQFNKSYSYPPAHITLFIPKNQLGGIPLNAEEDYEQLSLPVSNTDSLNLSHSIKLL